MLQVIDGVAFSVGQSVEHLLGRFPSNFSVPSHVPHRISGQFEFVQDLGDESMPAFGGSLGFSLLARHIYPESKFFSHPQFHFSGPLRVLLRFKLAFPHRSPRAHDKSPRHERTH
jgi:hypothetical protein